MYEQEDQALAALNHAIDLGITYLDTAYAYGDGKSETRVRQGHGHPQQGSLAGHKNSEPFLRRLHAPPGG